MSDALELNEKPEAAEVVMICGWRQWADAGSISSSLPQYLIQQMGARKIGTIKPDGFYLFQIPGTHDLVRPIVKFENGYPLAIETPHTEIYYASEGNRGTLILLGDEPHLDIERYTNTVLELAKTFNVRRIASFGGVYGELPYDKERMVSCIYSLPELEEEIKELSVNLSDYQGGASIGSYLCRRAGERSMEYIGFFAFVPTYSFSNVMQVDNTIRIENDFMAWLGVMRRVDHMFKMQMDLTDLEEKSQRLVEVINEKVDELDQASPQLGVREYLERLSEGYTEQSFDPLDDVWQDEISRLFDEDDNPGS